VFLATPQRQFSVVDWIRWYFLQRNDMQIPSLGDLVDPTTSSLLQQNINSNTHTLFGLSFIWFCSSFGFVMMWKPLWDYKY
jgi:hypothetical protein